MSDKSDKKILITVELHKEPGIWEGANNLTTHVQAARAKSSLLSPQAFSLNNDLALHASPLMGLAVVRVLASHIEFGGGLLSRGVKVVLVGEGLGVDASGDGILVEDDVVGEARIVHPGHGVALGDSDGGGVEDERT